MRWKLHNFLSFSLPVFLCIDRHCIDRHTHTGQRNCVVYFLRRKMQPLRASPSLLLFPSVPPLQCANKRPYLVAGPLGWDLDVVQLEDWPQSAGNVKRACAKRHGRDSSPKNFDLRHKRFKQFTSTAPSNIATRNNSERVLDSPWRSPTAEPTCGWWLSTWLGSSRVFSMTEPAWSARSNSCRSSLRRPRSSALLAAQTSWYVSNPSGFAGCWSWMAILRVSRVVK